MSKPKLQPSTGTCWVRITKRKTKLQPSVQVGNIYHVIAVDGTKATGATVLTVESKDTKKGTMRINNDRFDWEAVTATQLVQEKKEAQFRQQVKTDVERILGAFTYEEHLQITYIPLVLNEIAWHWAYKAMQLGASYRVQDLRKLSRVLKELRKHYERTVCKDLLPSDLNTIQQQAQQFIADNTYNFQIQFYTISNVFSKQFGKCEFEDMRVYALMSQLAILCSDEHNKRCDELMRKRLGKVQAALRMPAMDSLYTGIECYVGEIPQPFQYNDSNVQMCLGIMRNNLLKANFRPRRNESKNS